MYGLIDCNNFFVSCERVVDPSLNGRAVVVLGSNDGCVVARSNEAKALGIPMGIPVYQIRELIRRENVATCSSNFDLYTETSARVMKIIADNAPMMEVYSIDEAFVDLSGIVDPMAFARELVGKIIDGTGIPVSMGIAPTMTLAKAGSKFAKQYAGYRHVCAIDTPEKRVKALHLLAINDVWGIGRRMSKSLKAYGINNAEDFVNAKEQWVSDTFSITALRTWRELQGTPCMGLNAVKAAKKQICTSRSFRHMVDDFESLRTAVAGHAASCALKLRNQATYAKELSVFIHTNRHRTDLPQLYRDAAVKFPSPTADTAEIVTAAEKALRSIYAKGYLYKKAGVVITEITGKVQLGIFDSAAERDKRNRLMSAIDALNKENKGSVKLAVQSTPRSAEER